MDKRGSSLAARFRKAVVSEEQRKKDEEAARLRALEVAVEARDSLLSDLADFGRELGVVKVRVKRGVTMLSRGDRSMSFTPQEEGDIQVSIDGDSGGPFRLYREPALELRWVVSLHRRGREQRLPLFDQGLEELLVLGLGLPRPSDAP